MKQILVASFIGAVILFLWNFLSWMVLPVHSDTFRYTPTQDALMQSIVLNTPSSGFYAVPNIDPSLPPEEYKAAHKKHMEESATKPSAMIMYWKEGMSMGAGMFVGGFLLYFGSAVCVSLLLVAGRHTLISFAGRWGVVMLVAIVVLFESQFAMMNWMYTPWHYAKGFVIDTFVSWALCGAWLAWYFGRAARPAVMERPKV